MVATISTITGSSSSPSSRRSRFRKHPTLTTLCLLSFLSITFGLVLWTAVNSDRAYLHPILTQIIPAGHCACETATVFECSSCLTCSHQTTLSLAPSSHPSNLSESSSDPDSESNSEGSEPGQCEWQWEFEYARDGHNAGLSREQCDAAFPGLFEDVHRGRSYWSSRGGISIAELDTITLNPGMARARIANGQLYVLATRARGEDHRRKILAALSAMHRALITDTQDQTSSPRDIEFIFSIEDKLSDVADAFADPIWTLARTASEEAAWLMPDFGFWSWDHAHTEIGPYDAVVEDAVEYDALPWGERVQKLVWRGKPSFAPKLRRALLDRTRGRAWADVQAVDWHRHDSEGEGEGNVLGLGEHCRYGFIAHVEGRSYSASLKYRQACRSVIVAHKLQYIQHHHYLLIPSGASQNYVEVERDFSDLEAKIAPLLTDPARAQAIADNSVRAFRERYLTPAAEACYWRGLWDGYAGVWNGTSSAESAGSAGSAGAIEFSERGGAGRPSGSGRRRGMRYESFVLQRSQAMLEFDAR
ncbi:glycosyl transferase family 90-domain-containing protein [Aspergillus carlsbadensis]|nr:glycosyl transferase family 90-domain-containing protein [Aspergillus carlsbadensis]